MKNKKNTDLQVVQKNKFIQKHQKQLRSLTFQDLLLFKTIVSKINAKDTLFKESYTITYKELDKAGYPSKYRYSEINKSLENLASKMLSFETKESIVTCGVIQNKWIFEKRSEELKIIVYPEMADFLIGIKEQFTKYPLSVLSNLTNKYDIILFEYFSTFKEYGQQKVTIDKLKELLNIKDKYKRTPLFKKELLNKSINRINEFTDINIKYTEVKEKNKITGFIFFIESDKKYSIKEYIKEIINTDISIDTKVYTIIDIIEVQAEFDTLYTIQLLTKEDSDSIIQIEPQTAYIKNLPLKTLKEKISLYSL